MKALVFEDKSYVNLLPLTYTKATYEILCGGRRQIERIINAFKGSVAFLSRPSFAENIKNRWNVAVNEIPKARDYLLINGSFILSESELLSLKDKLAVNQALIADGSAVALRLNHENLDKFLVGAEINEGFMRKLYKKKYDRENRLIRYPWNIIDYLTQSIMIDVGDLRGSFRKMKGSRGQYPVLVSGEVNVESHVFFDCSDGPVVMEDEVEVQSFTRISGPSWIKRKSLILSALIREGSVVGEVCKVGGEMEESVIEGFSNKAHRSYLGHSYVGEWVNVGAFTVTSNLKNTYGTVKMKLNGRRVDTERIKLGSFIADYAKTAVSTSIYAGKKIGVSSHVHGVVYEDVPSFTVWAKSLGKVPTELYLESALKTQRRMFERRGIKQTNTHRELLKTVFELTREERLSAGVARRKFKL